MVLQTFGLTHENWGTGKGGKREREDDIGKNTGLNVTLKLLSTSKSREGG